MSTDEDDYTRVTVQYWRDAGDHKVIDWKLSEDQQHLMEAKLDSFTEPDYGNVTVEYVPFEDDDVCREWRITEPDADTLVAYLCTLKMPNREISLPPSNNTDLS